MKYFQARSLSFIAWSIVSPILEGFRVTLTPALYKASIFDLAVPLPPEIIAPAWPILLPGGAVTPAINEATGLFLVLFCFMYYAASS